MDMSKARQRLREIAKERQRHETAVLKVRREMVAGSLVSRYTRCKRAGCKCGKGEPHGPFLYLSRKEQGKTRWTYIGKGSHGKLAEAVTRYREFSEHVRALRRLAAEAESCYAAIGGGLERTPQSFRAEVK